MYKSLAAGIYKGRKRAAITLKLSPKGGGTNANLENFFLRAPAYKVLTRSASCTTRSEAARMALVSATGFLGLLQDEPELRVYALENLNQLVDEFWAEIADSAGKMCDYDSITCELTIVSEVLAEDDTFPARDLASLVASKARSPRIRRASYAS